MHGDVSDDTEAVISVTGSPVDRCLIADELPRLLSRRCDHYLWQTLDDAIDAVIAGEAADDGGPRSEERRKRSAAVDELYRKASIQRSRRQQVVEQVELGPQLVVT